MPRFIYKSATELAALIRDGKATSVEIVREHIAQIKKHNDELNAVVIPMFDEALILATLLDEEAKTGSFMGPLHGVPVTIKEQFWIKGLKSTNNAKMFKDFVAPEDSELVKRIKRAGGVILGKTNVPRHLTDYQVQGDIYAEGKNPYNTDHTPGGSTGGGAAALATGMTTLELGGDLGGSVRLPACFCGLYGLKPTDKTVPLHGHVPLPEKADTFLVHMAQAGPLARNLDDLELLWKIIVGPDARDRNIPRIDWAKPSGKELSDYNVAWVDGWPGRPVSNQVSTSIRTLIEKIAGTGAKTKNTGPENEQLHEETLKLFLTLFPYVIAQRVPWIIRQIMKMQFKTNLLKGNKKYRKEFNKAFKYSGQHYARAMLTKALVTEQWERFFEQYDFLICPMAYGPAFKRCKIGSKIQYEENEIVYIDYTWPFVACFNASGHPAINIPTGLSKEGLPLGVQIVGPYWSEPELLHFSKEVAKLTQGFIRPEGY